jgi:hypothetical protein
MAYGDRLRDALLELDEIIHLLETSLRDDVQRLTVPALQAWVGRREELRTRLASLEAFVLHALEDEVGLDPDVVLGRENLLDLLESKAPDDVATIRLRIDQIRHLIRALTEKDARASAMLHRARCIVRGYFQAVFPPVQAYGRGGEARGDMVAAMARSSTKTTA